MASILGSRTFSSKPKGTGSGVANAKKLADLYIKQHTNDAGDVTDPAVYDYVVNNIYAPYVDNVDIQRKMAEYANKQKDLSSKEFEQDSTIGDLTSAVYDALYSKSDVARDPSQMAAYSSAALDNIINQMDEVIDHFEGINKPSERIQAYRKDVLKMADGQRALVNALQSGTLPKDLDGYGYFIQTSPLDGSLQSVALLPVASAPADMKENMKRIESAANFGNGKLPVYLPVTKDSEGNVTARLGNNVWSGMNTDATLSVKSAPDFKDGNFQINDMVKFPIKRTDIDSGSFGRSVAGVKDGKTVFNYFYRGEDGKVRNLDEETLNAFKSDPIFGQKLSGAIPLISPDEARQYGTSPKLTSDELKSFSATAQERNAQAALNAPQAGPQNPSFFRRAAEAIPAVAEAATSIVQNADTNGLSALSAAAGGIAPMMTAAAGAAAKTAASTAASVASKVKSFFGNKNKPNAPDAPSEGSKGGVSVNDVVEKGKSFFRGNTA